MLLSCDQQLAEEYNPEYSASSTQKGDEVMILGIHPLHNPKRLHEIFAPIADYLSKNIDGVQIKIEASRNSATFEKKLSCHFQFLVPKNNSQLGEPRIEPK